MSSSKNQGEMLYEWFKFNNYNEFGVTISGDAVRELLGIEMPAYASKATYDALSLKELSAIDYVRDKLLDEGKYLVGRRGDYEVLLPSQNAKQVELYMSSADRKLRRAQRLLSNTPQPVAAATDNKSARIMLKRDAIKAQADIANLARQFNVPATSPSHANP